MKTKKLKKKRLLPIISGIILIILLISAGLLYRYQQQNKPFTIDSLNLSSWTKNENEFDFWFPKDNIIVVKKIKNFYVLSQNTSQTFATPIIQEYVDKILNNTKIQNLTKNLKEQSFSLIKDSTGLFGNTKTSSNQYYVETYQKNNYWCQLNISFECFDNKCTNNDAIFGCGKFDFDQEFSVQKNFYQKIKDKIDFDENNEAINFVKSNSNYTAISITARSDGGIIYLDNKNQIVCDDICCEKSFPNSIGGWCTDDYQTIDTYQPISL